MRKQIVVVPIGLWNTNVTPESLHVLPFANEGLLKGDFPKARVMTFGYVSKITYGYHAAHQGNIFCHARNILFSLEGKRKNSTKGEVVYIMGFQIIGVGGAGVVVKFAWWLSLHATGLLFQDHHFPFPFLPFVDV
jgi:hypothetical protein